MNPTLSTHLQEHAALPLTVCGLNIRQDQMAAAPAVPVINLRQPAQMLAVAAQLVEIAQEQQAQLAAQASAVEFAAAVADAANCQTIEQVGKLFGLSRNALFKKLRNMGLLMRNNLPAQEHLAAQRFKVVEKVRKDPRGQKYLYQQTLITGVGLRYIQRQLGRRPEAGHD